MFAWLLVVGCALAGQVQAAADEELRLTVRQLVSQLDAPQYQTRQQAEEQLLGLGPAVLDLLPQITDRTPAEVQQRLGRIRQKLQRAAAESAAQASLVTLKADGVLLSKVLAALQEQTGNKIVDFRQQFGQVTDDPPLTIDFLKTPFWEALDKVLDQAALTVYPFGQEQAISVVARAQRQLQRSGSASYCGPFRFEPVLIQARRDLRQPAGQSLQLTLEVAWEPRLKPISLRQRLVDLEAVDEQGRRLEIDSRRAELEVPVKAGSTAIDLLLPLVPPPREVKRIGRLKGTLTALLPGRLETFRFDRLPTAANVEKRVAAAAVVLEGVRRNQDAWEVRVRVRFDQAGEALESHRGWVFQNEAYMEGPDGKPIAFGAMETTRQTDNEIGLAYLFNLQGPPGNYTFVYKTPAAIIPTPAEYEIKDLPLP